MNKKQGFGAATSLENRSITWLNQEWDSLVDELLKRTQRTKLIMDLTGTDVNYSRFKDDLTRRVKSLGLDVIKPRGKAASTENAHIITNLEIQVHASYLMGLHFGSQDPQTNSDPRTFNFLENCKKLLMVYSRYEADLGHEEKHKLSFERYILLLEQIKEGILTFRVHKVCGARLVNRAERGLQDCYFCSGEENAKNSRDIFTSLVQKNSISQPLKKVESGK